MLTSLFFIRRKDYSPHLYANDPMHFGAAEGNMQLIQEMVSRGANMYQGVRDGETPLHVSIANQQQQIWTYLMSIYEQDFAKVNEYLQRTVPLGILEALQQIRSVAVACSEEQCKRAKELERQCENEDVQWNNFRIVLLKNARENEHVALLRITDRNESQVKGFLDVLMANGALSWDYSRPGDKCDTLLQLATFRGEIDLIRRLVRNGADLSQHGREGRIAFMEACNTMNMTIIQLLLEEYIDRFDPTVLDQVGYSGLVHILPHGDADAFDYVLRKLVAYRKQHFGETDSQAFNELFRYEHERWPELSIWGMTDEKSRDTFLEAYLEEYEYDLSFQSGYQFMLMEVIIRHTAKEYYRAQIRQKPELLALTNTEGCNVLHCLLWSDELHFVRELYDTRPEHCKNLFESAGAVGCLASVICDQNNRVLIFLLEKHLEFIQSIADELMDAFFEEDLLPLGIFDEPFDILVEHLPELEPRVLELQYKVVEEEMEASMDDEGYEEYDRSLTRRMLGSDV